MMDRKQILGIICMLVCPIVLLHQFVFYGKLLELKDVLHHEWFAFVFLAFGIGLLIGEGLE